MEQLNIEGKRSGEGFVCDRLKLIRALAQAQAPKVEVCDVVIGRKGFIGYLKLLSGGIVKIAPGSKGNASDKRIASKGLKITCGAHTGCVDHDAWVTDRMQRQPFHTEVRVSPCAVVQPNIGASELSEAITRQLPFVAKDNNRPVLHSVRFAVKEGKLCLTSADGFKLLEQTIDLGMTDSEGEVIVNADDLKGIVAPLKRVRRARLTVEPKTLIIETEQLRYKLTGVEGAFPDYNSLIPDSGFAGEARFYSGEVLRASASLGALYLDKEIAVVIRIRDGLMKLLAQDDVSEALVEAQTVGEAEVRVNMKYLHSVLKSLGGMIELKVKDAASPMLYTQNGSRALLMPMNPPAPKVVVPPQTPDTVVAQAEAVASQAERAQAATDKTKSGKRHNKARHAVAAAKPDRKAVAAAR